MSNEWKDASKYSRTEGNRRGQCEPFTWELVVNDIRIVVTRWIYGAPDSWYLRCDKLRMEHIDMGDALDAALVNAVDRVADELRKRANEFIEAASRLDMMY